MDIKKVSFVVLFGLLFSFGWGEDEKYTLGLKYKKGEKITKNFTLGNNLQDSSGGINFFDKALNVEYTDEILELDENGRIKKLRREVLTYGANVDKATKKIKPNKGGIKMEATPVGMSDWRNTTLIITKEDDETKIKDGDEKEISVPKWVADTIDDCIGILLPERPVKIKEKWTVDKEKIKQWLNFMDIVGMYQKNTRKLKDFSGTIECQLDSISKENIAKISYELDINAILEFKNKERTIIVGGKDGKVDYETETLTETTKTYTEKGEIYFDVLKGQIVSTNAHRDSKGKSKTKNSLGEVEKKQDKMASEETSEFTYEDSK